MSNLSGSHEEWPSPFFHWEVIVPKTTMLELLRWVLWAALSGGSLAFRGPVLQFELLIQMLGSPKPGPMGMDGAWIGAQNPT